jgi:hypothetical protein
VVPSGFRAPNGTLVTGFTKHGINRAIGDGGDRAGTTPAAILDTIRYPRIIRSGVDDLGRPFEVFRGWDARLIINPRTGEIVSANPLSRAGAQR